MQSIYLFLGIALCAMALLQFMLWTAQSFSLISQNKKQFELSQQLLRKQLKQQTKRQDTPPKETQLSEGDWSGFRWFKVDKLVPETDGCTSVYLIPEDGKPIVDFRPGQHLTFKFQIPGQSKPVVRCYSLSDAPNKNYYRISVKKALAPPKQPELPTGKASSYINDVLRPGDRIEVKSPSGHFFLDEEANCPVVLLAGGIGITPMVSMTNKLLHAGTSRPIAMFYGARFGSDQAFKEHLQQLSKTHDNFNMISCYSNPLPEDVQGKDYQVEGFVSIDLLKQALPGKNCHFYLCGPPPFMEALYDGLMEWGVPESNVNFEAFGPASIGKSKQKTSTESTNEKASMITFASSDVSAKWDPTFDSLLELAEENDVIVDSGCRAGSCGTCATGVLKGKVKYPNHDSVECESGKCLLCIAKPDGDLELDT